MIYTELIRDMTWSYSRLECFESCPYRWFLKYIEHEQEEPLFYSSYGSFMHELLAGIYKGELTREAAKDRFLFGFAETVRGERPPGRIAADYIDAGFSYLKDFEPLPVDPAGVELNVEFRVGRVPFTGFLDLLGRCGRKYTVIDHKSRNLKPRSGRGKPTQNDRDIDSMLRQLYLYAEAVYQTFGEYPASLCFNCFRNGTFIEEPFQKDKLSDALTWAEGLVGEIEQCEDFGPRPEYFKCRYLCGVHNQCCYYEGA